MCHNKCIDFTSTAYWDDETWLTFKVFHFCCYCFDPEQIILFYFAAFIFTIILLRIKENVISSVYLRAQLFSCSTFTKSVCISKKLESVFFTKRPKLTLHSKWLQKRIGFYLVRSLLETRTQNFQNVHIFHRFEYICVQFTEIFNHLQNLLTPDRNSVWANWLL